MRLRSALAAVILSVAAIATASPPSSQPTTLPISPAEAARLDRGDRLREALLDALESAYAHNDHWPTTLPDAKIAYTPPTTMPADLEDRRFIAPSTVVAHERLGDHADGAWLGYADGHLEFVTDAAALAAAESQLPQAWRSVDWLRRARRE